MITFEGALISPEVAAEIEALHIEIKDLKEALRLTIQALDYTIQSTRGFKEPILDQAIRKLI